MSPSVGMWIWTVTDCEGGVVSAIVDRAKQAALGHVLIKTNDGTAQYNGTLGPLVSALKAAGIHIWAWQYARGQDPEAEAEAFGSRALALGVNGLCVDAEVEFESTAMAPRATAYMTRLRSVAGTLPIALSSYYRPQLHPHFPWAEFLGQSNFAMPQVYWFGNDPAVALADSYADYGAFIAQEQIIPTGAAYAEATGNPDNIGKFIAKATDLGASSVNFWSWQHATPAMWAEITGQSAV